MARFRPRPSWDGLTESARDSEAAPTHIPCAGELLVKQLVAKQANTQTSLAEQLNITQNFVSGRSLEDGASVADSFEDLSRRSGLPRQELESHLSVKPGSEMSKLYRFALSNSSEARSVTLLEQLPDHPFNNLKAIEQGMMDGFGTTPGRSRNRKRKKLEGLDEQCDSGAHTVEGSDFVDIRSRGRKRKHRVRRKKKFVVAGCEERPGGSCIGVGKDLVSVDIGSEGVGMKKSLWDMEEPSEGDREKPGHSGSGTEEELISVDEESDVVGRKINSLRDVEGRGEGGGKSRVSDDGTAAELAFVDEGSEVVVRKKSLWDVEEPSEGDMEKPGHSGSETEEELVSVDEEIDVVGRKINSLRDVEGRGEGGRKSRVSDDGTAAGLAFVDEGSEVAVRKKSLWDVGGPSEGGRKMYTIRDGVIVECQLSDRVGTENVV